MNKLTKLSVVSVLAIAMMIIPITNSGKVPNILAQSQSATSQRVPTAGR